MTPDNSKERYQELAEKWLNGSISPEEAREYARWYNSGQDGEVLIPKGFALGDQELRDRILQNVIGRPSRVKQLWYAAAAAILILCLAGYLVFKPRPVARIAVIPHDKTAPAANRASLKISNGQTLFLDSAGTGVLASVGGVDVVKLGDGKIAYSGRSDSVYLNTLTNPRGSRVLNIALGDGTRVWLNAGSRLVFPSAFTGKERSVEVDGEAYFEVAPNPGMAFVVRKGTEEIQVLGTHFNVEAYDDEETMRVTLLEGSVKVQGVLLKPNEAAEVAGARAQVIRDADVEAAVAWKNGYFDFKGMDIGAVMRRIGRWYDMDVVFEGQRPQGHYTAMLSMDVNASTVLQGLAYSGIHYRIEGNKVIITQ